MELNSILLKQQSNNDKKNKGNQNTCELLDKDDVLNDKHITNVKMEAEMLSRNKISFSITFSTHSKDVSISVKEGRDTSTQTHAARHYKTGYTQARGGAKAKLSKFDN